MSRIVATTNNPESDTLRIQLLKNAVRSIPDFPKQGIIFKDITPILQNKDLFHQAIDALAERYVGQTIDKVVAVEARGFIFGSALAYTLGAGFVPVRKKGKLPYRTISQSYSLEYGEDSIEMHEDGLITGDSVLLCDDLLATGGTMRATLELVRKRNVSVVEMAFLIELTFLKGRANLGDAPIFSLLKL